MHGQFTLEASVPVTGLPAAIEVQRGAASTLVRDLRVAQTGELIVTVKDTAGNVLCRSNPLRLVDALPLRPYWADLRSTCGTSTRSADARAGPIHSRTSTGTSVSYACPGLGTT
ncbi:MAG: hypothetical protein ABI831_09145 [Betaproteobacteria bacterium]